MPAARALFDIPHFSPFSARRGAHSVVFSSSVMPPARNTIAMTCTPQTSPAPLRRRDSSRPILSPSGSSIIAPHLDPVPYDPAPGSRGAPSAGRGVRIPGRAGETRGTRDQREAHLIGAASGRGVEAWHVASIVIKMYMPMPTLVQGDGSTREAKKQDQQEEMSITSYTGYITTTSLFPTNTSPRHRLRSAERDEPSHTTHRTACPSSPAFRPNTVRDRIKLESITPPAPPRWTPQCARPGPGPGW